MDDKGISGTSFQNKPDANELEKPVIPRKSRRVLDGVTELYRHFDKFGRLLYVGISMSGIGRLSTHRRECAWFNLISVVTIERLPNRAAALVAEAKAIQLEKPYFNRSHRRGWRDVKWGIPKLQITYGADLANILKNASIHQDAREKRWLKSQ
jgi:hypothetical protein